MTPEEQTAAAIKAMVTELPPCDQRTIFECADKIRATIKDYGQHGMTALAIVGSEAAAEEE